MGTDAHAANSQTSSPQPIRASVFMVSSPICLHRLSSWLRLAMSILSGVKLPIAYGSSHLRLQGLESAERVAQFTPKQKPKIGVC